MNESYTPMRRVRNRGRLTFLLVVLCTGLVVDSDAGMANELPPPGYDLVLHRDRTLAVIGVRHGITGRGPESSESLRDRRIGFGLNSLLAQGFYDTRQFRLVEDRDIRTRQIIEDLVHTYWIEPRSEYSELDLQWAAKQLNVDILAYGSVSYTVVSAQRVSIGPLTRFVQKLGITVNICLFSISAQVGFCREGQGVARQEGVGVIYEFRHDRLDFEKNAMGKATKQAVEQGVRDLMASIHFAE